MKAPTDSVVMRNAVFAWIAGATALLLLIPLAAMQFTAAVDWGLADFLVMGVLIFACASTFVLLARKLPRRYWLAIGLVVAAVFLYLWAELAVGIFTTLGN